MSLVIPIANQNNFYSQKLSGDFLRLYNASVDNLSRGVLSTRVSCSMSEEELNNGLNPLTEAIIYGCPEFFYIEQRISATTSGTEVTLSFTNKYMGENLSELCDKLDKEINRIV